MKSFIECQLEKLAEYAETLDGFLFSGGVDVDPVKYGEEKMFDSVEIDAVRDEFEEALFKAVYPTGKPILGICRGIQLQRSPCDRRGEACRTPATA